MNSAYGGATVLEAPNAPSSIPLMEMAMGLVLVVIGIKMQAGEGASPLRTLLLFGLCAIITAYGFFRDPYAPLYCCVFIAPISKAFGTSFALMIGGALLVSLRRGICRWKWQFSLPGLAYCLWCLASLLWAGEVFTELDSWIAQALGPMLLAFLIAGLRDSAFRRNLMLMVVVACCFGTIFSFRNWHAGIGEMGSGGRFYSLTRPDTFSAWLLFGIFGAIAWLLDGGAPKWLRWFLLSSIPWQVCGLGLCGFRAAILAAGLGVIMVCLCLKHPLKMLGLVSLAALPVVGVTLLVPNLFNTVLARFGTIEADRGSARLDIWEGALKMFWDRPLAGYGLDNFKIISGRFYSRAMLPHSIYVGTLVELGVIGAVLLLLWLVTLLRKASRTPERVWVLPLITAYIFQAMFLHEFYFSCFWIAIALVEGSPQAVARVRSGTRRWLEPGRESVMEPIPRFKVRASQAFE